MSNKNYDFAGWATKYNIKCSDGKTIMPKCFSDCDGKTVPIVWNHRHEDINNVLGHAVLEARDEGVYAYGYLNHDLDKANNAKRMIEHGDINSLSIYANKLKQSNGSVYHGIIRELSLVLAGANIGAYIDSVISHDDFDGEEEFEATIYNDSYVIHSSMDDEEDVERSVVEHADKNDEEDDSEMPNNEKTIGEIIATFNDEQKKALEAVVGMALEEKEGDEDMKHNAFEEDVEVLTHSEMTSLINEAKVSGGSLKETFLAHGITNVEGLFPEAKLVRPMPETFDRDQSWVSVVMNGVHNTPFSRTKSMYFDITADEARAKGYIKGKEKKEEVITHLKRTTDPQTVYKLQKMHRDDVLDITDFDVIGYLKNEMRGKLSEEIARAILIGDGRQASSDDKIDPLHIRPIWGDAPTYTINRDITIANNATADEIVDSVITEAIKCRKDYKGSGNLTFFTTEDFLADAMLMKDGLGYRLYKTESELATAMRFSRIVTVPVMEGIKRQGSDGKDHELVGIAVNLDDYNVGKDKGGEVNMFDDFDIKFNQMMYLIETRMSGALTRPKSAITFEIVRES